MIHSFVDNDEGTKWKFCNLLTAVQMPVKVWNPGNFSVPSAMFHNSTDYCCRWNVEILIGKGMEGV